MLYLFKHTSLRIVLVFFNVFLIMSIIFILSTIVMRQIWMPSHSFLKDIPFAKTEYLSYIKGIFTKWDWGTSAKRGDNIWKFLIMKIPYTLAINAVALVIYLTLGFFFGIVTALKKNKIIDPYHYLVHVGV